MTETAENVREYFLAIDGERQGPFREPEILEKIQAGTLPPETLVWYEGLEDWSPLDSIETFRDAIGDFSDSEKHPPPPENTEISESGIEQQGGAEQPPSESTESDSFGQAPTFAKRDAVASPVFDEDASQISHSHFLSQRMILVVMGMLLLLLASVAGFYVWSNFRPSLNQLKAADPQSAGKPKLSPQAIREAQFQKGLSDIFVNPQQAVELLTKLALENMEDKPGKEAWKAVLDYYKRMKRYQDAGRWLLKGKQPLDAAKMFLEEPPSYPEAESAYFIAFEQLKDPAQKREALVESIRILLAPLANPVLALQRIQLLEREYPGIPHPYKYYLRGPEEKMVDLFGRLSFFFVQSLLDFLDSELPQLKLSLRPSMELRKDNLLYRIVGKYKGEVHLNRDHLTQIYFLFWLHEGRWHLVDTNVTAERKKYSALEKEKLRGAALPAPKMLAYLESLFQSQFPDHALHEGVDLNDLKRKKKIGVE